MILEEYNDEFLAPMENYCVFLLSIIFIIGLFGIFYVTHHYGR